ncbi:MAG: hypothetical protein ABI625_18975 [bacterium]
MRQAPEATNAQGNATKVIVGDQALQLAGPDRDALRAQRRELRSQLDALESTRSQLTQRLDAAPKSSPAQGELAGRVAEVNQRIATVEQMIASNEQQMASSSFPAIVEVPPGLPPSFFPPPGIPDQVWPLAALFIVVAILPLSIALARRVWRQSARAVQTVPSETPDTAERLSRMEVAIEATAVEVERIGEGQRYLTRLLGNRAAEAQRELLDIPGSRRMSKEHTTPI